MFADAATLTAHRPPALLVDAVVACAPEGGQVRLRVAAWDELQLIEGCAQAIAVLQGARGSTTGSALAHGLLVAAADVVCQGPAPAQAAVLVTVTHGKRLGQQQQHVVTATWMTTILIQGTLTTVDG